MKRFRNKVEIYLGAVLGWVDITADVRGPIRITRGRTTDGGRADRGRCTLRLAAEAGNYSPRNPAGAWYGLIGRNTPLRVSAGRVAGALVGRFYGEVSEWPIRANLRGNVRHVDVQAVGILQRLGQGEPPKLSPLRRTIAATGPVAYWPGEDGDTAGQAGAATPDAPPLIASGSVNFAATDDYNTGTLVYGTSRLGDLAAGGTLRATLPAAAVAATQSAWTVHVFGRFDVAFSAGDIVLMEWTTPGGTYTRWQLVENKTTLHTQVIGYTPAGVATVLVDRNGVLGGFRTWTVSAQQSGSLVNVTYRIDGTTAFGGSVAATLAGVTSVTVNPTGTTSTQPMPFGHVAVWDTADFSYGVDATIDAYGGVVFPAHASWKGEAATDRLARVCAEQDVPLALTAPPAGLVSRMGWQPTAATLDLVDQCVDVDGGYLYEQRNALGLAYRTRASLYNQTPVPIAYVGQLGDPFDPVDDANDVRNDVTVKRDGGSSARAVQRSGPNSVLPPPAGVGRVPTEVTLNLADDGQLADQAWWRVHLGTVDRPRYPSLTVQLASPEWQAAPAVLDALLAVDTGDVLEVTGLPAWAAGDVRTLVLGYSEELTEETWEIAYAGVPAQPWDVAEVDGAARYASDGSTLAAALLATAVPVSAGGSNPGFESGTAQWGATAGTIGTTTAWSAEGAAAGVLTASGAANPRANHSSTATVVAPGQYVRYRGTLMAPAALPGTASITLQWFNGGAFVSQQVLSATLTPGVPVTLEGVFIVPAGVDRAGRQFSMNGTPAAGTVLYGDDFRVEILPTLQIASTPENGPWTTNPAAFPLDVRVGEQRVTVAAITGAASPQTAAVSALSVNGVVATWPAGTEVDVWRPAVVAL